MKSLPRFCIGLAVFAWVLSASPQTKAARSKTNEGFWYIRNANPQKISHYMREAGLTYLEKAQRDYEAQMRYSMELTDEQKSASESEDEALEMLEERMMINLQAPADKDFLSVLKQTGQMASLAGLGVGLCSRGTKPQAECDTRLSRYVACRNWMKESIDTGVFDDSWHTECYGDWAEEHAK